MTYEIVGQPEKAKSYQLNTKKSPDLIDFFILLLITLSL